MLAQQMIERVGPNCQAAAERTDHGDRLARECLEARGTRRIDHEGALPVSTAANQRDCTHDLRPASQVSAWSH
jgi:hypothetical protein